MTLFVFYFRRLTSNGGIEGWTFISVSRVQCVKAALFERLSENEDHRYSHGTVWTCPCGAVSHDLSSGIPVLRLFTFTVYHLG